MAGRRGVGEGIELLEDLDRHREVERDFDELLRRRQGTEVRGAIEVEVVEAGTGTGTMSGTRIGRGVIPLRDRSRREDGGVRVAVGRRGGRVLESTEVEVVGGGDGVPVIRVMGRGVGVGRGGGEVVLEGVEGLVEMRGELFPRCCLLRVQVLVTWTRSDTGARALQRHVSEETSSLYDILDLKQEQH